MSSLSPPHRLALVVGALSLCVPQLLGCPPCGEEQPCAEDAGPPGGLWEEAFDTAAFGSVSSVWGTGPDDVFAVGGGEAGVIFHFDGEAWAKMSHPEVPLLVWVYGFAPDDVIAVGTGGGALRYDGETWTLIDTGTEDDLWGVFGFASDDVWFVGGDVNAGPPLLLHYDGSTVTSEDLPATENPLGARALFKVWGIDGKLFAVGQTGLILERTAGAWVRRPAGPEADDDFVSLWGTSGDHIVAVGGRANARIARYDGTSWATTAPTGIGGLNGVFMERPGTATIAGVFGTLGSYDVERDEVRLDDVDTFFDLHAVWGDGAGTTYAVGGNFLQPFRGIALKQSATESAR